MVGRWYRAAACGAALVLALWGAPVPAMAQGAPAGEETPAEYEAPARDEAPVEEEASTEAVAPGAESGDVPAATPSDLAPAAEGACTTWAALQVLMADETVTAVTLGADIVVDENASLTVDRTLTVEMGPYGLDVEAELDLYGDGALHFEGEGGARPLIRLSTGQFNINTTVHITARGNGATALLLEAEHFTSAWQLRVGPFFNGKRGLYITADGVGATAIHTTGVTDLEEFWTTSRQFNTITISAAQGTGIRCEDTSAISLAFCHISAGVASVETAGPLILDGSVLAPQPQAAGVTTYTRAANWGDAYDLYRYGVWTRVGEAPQLDRFLPFILKQFTGQVSYESTQINYPVAWTYETAALAQPGTTVLGAVPTLGYRGMAVENLAHGMEHHLALHVVEPDTQHLIGAAPAYSEWGDDRVTLYLMEPLAEGAGFTLEYRPAGEQNWQVAENATLSAWYPDQITVAPFDLSVDTEFRLTMDGLPTNTLLMPGGLAYYTGIGDVPTTPEPGEPEQPDTWEPPEIAPDGSANAAGQRDLAWLAARPEVKRIVLTESVTIIHPEDVDIWDAALELGQAGPLTVDTGEHGLFLQARMRLSDAVTFTGGGTALPLLTVEYGGSFTGSGRLRVTADAAGAVAVRCTAGLNPFHSYGTHIAATGAGAVALEVTARPKYSYETFYLEWVELAAPGAGGVGLRCTQQLGVKLHYCHITGGGASVQAASGGEAIGCALAPAAAGVEVKKVYANWGEVDRNRFAYGVWTLKGEVPELPRPLLSAMYVAEGDGFATDQWMNVDIDWACDEAVLDTVGTHLLSATPSLRVHAALIEPMEHGKTYELALHVAEPGRQYLTYAYKTRATSFNSIGLTLMRPIEDPDACRLWYRTDGGAWQSLPLGEDGVEYTPPTLFTQPTLSLRVEDFSMDYEFKLEVGEGALATTTNTLEVPAGEAFFLGDSGGDRDGSDRVDEGELPAEPGRPQTGGGADVAPTPPAAGTGAPPVRRAGGASIAPAGGSTGGEGPDQTTEVATAEAVPDGAGQPGQGEGPPRTEEAAPEETGVPGAGLVVVAAAAAAVLGSGLFTRWRRRRRG